MQKLYTIALAVLLLCGVGCEGVVAQGRSVQALDSEWRFLRGDAKGAEAERFDVGSWRTVDLPHDWSIEGPFEQDSPTGQGGAFLPSGVGWYRKEFTLSEQDAGKRISVEFDGVMANSEVWINGKSLGKRPNGYVGLRYELSGHLLYGKGHVNTLAVRVDDSAQPASRWYAGAGIYRHVRLVLTDQVHLQADGSCVTTPEVTDAQANVHVVSVVQNQSNRARNVSLSLTLRSPDGQSVVKVESAPQTAPAGLSANFEIDLRFPNPQRWSLEHPDCYQAILTVHDHNTVLDSEAVPFGIRTFRFDPKSGFWLNGKNFKIKGVCLHQDAGGLGVAVPAGVWERRLTLLKQFGVNAVRTAHMPVSPEFLDLCDRLGLLVMEEMFDCWSVGKNPYDYHLYFKQWAQRDVRDTVERDRNHPSLILYSIGNEIRDTPNATLARQELISLRDLCHQADPTRPVTQALFRPNASHDYDDGLADLLDVIGQNYRERELLAAHQAKPERKILGTENGHDRTTWLALRDSPAMAGQFLWTGIDYLGEARQWPAISNDSGLFDRTMEPRPLAYERRSWWSDRPMVYMARRVAPAVLTPIDPGYEVYQRRPQTLFSDWTPRSVVPHAETVEVYSNCEEVELLLNGKSLGRQPLAPDARPRIWHLSYEPGTLKAVGSNQGVEVATYELHTAGKPARILLSSDRSHLSTSRDDVACLRAVVTDQAGVPVPNADAVISFQIVGPGGVLAVDNGDVFSHEAFQGTVRHAYQGRCLATIRATAAGVIHFTASSPGLESASVVISAAQSVSE